LYNLINKILIYEKNLLSLEDGFLGADTFCNKQVFCKKAPTIVSDSKEARLFIKDRSCDGRSFFQVPMATRFSRMWRKGGLGIGGRGMVMESYQHGSMVGKAKMTQ